MKLTDLNVLVACQWLYQITTPKYVVSCHWTVRCGLCRPQYLSLPQPSSLDLFTYNPLIPDDKYTDRVTLPTVTDLIKPALKGREVTPNFSMC